MGAADVSPRAGPSTVRMYLRQISRYLVATLARLDATAQANYVSGVAMTGHVVSIRTRFSRNHAFLMATKSAAWRAHRPYIGRE